MTGVFYRYSIPRIPESLNKYAGRTNVWEYRKAKEEWREIMVLLCRNRPPAPLENAIVTLTYYFPDKRRRDPDNYAGKAILDGLVAAKVLKDDSFECVCLTLRAQTDRERPRVEIEVEEA